VSENLKNKMLGALAWSSVDRVAQQGTQAIIGIILARLLSPSDYGLMGVVMIFTTLSYILVEGGFTASLVRTKEITKEHTNTIFYSNLAVSISLYIIFFISAPLIANFFSQEELTPLIRVTNLALIFNSLYIVPYGLIERELNFKKLAKINIISTTLSGLSGVISAYYNVGVWALVIQQTSYHLIRSICFYAWQRWLPSLIFSKKIFKEYASFSVHILSSNILNIFFNNIYTFLLRKFYSVKQLGYYTHANKMAETANFTFSAIFGKTSYNLFAKIHDQSEKLIYAMRQMIQKSSLIIIPTTIFLIFAAKSLFLTLFGEKWLASVPYFQLICIANLLNIVYLINNYALNSVGKSKLSLKVEIIKRCLILISVLLCFSYGVMELMIGYAVSCLLSWFISLLQVNKTIGLKIGDQLKDIAPIMIWSIIICYLGYLSGLFTENLYYKLIIQGAVSLSLYIGVISIFYRELWNYIMKFLKIKK
jgi:O-antigen/teichoic acid export membrane protein